MPVVVTETKRAIGHPDCDSVDGAAPDCDRVRQAHHSDRRGNPFKRIAAIQAELDRLSAKSSVDAVTHASLSKCHRVDRSEEEGQSGSSSRWFICGRCDCDTPLR